MLRISTLSLVTALSTGLALTAQAGVVFEATTSNTTDISNNNNGTTGANISLSGATPNLLLASDGGNFFTGGFASTSDINTLNGSALTNSDVVVVQLTVDGVSHTGTSELRSRGFNFGVTSSASFDGNTPASTNNLLLEISAENSGNVLMRNSLGNFTEDAFTFNQASLEDGFGVTLTADVNGWTFSFTDATALSGTLTSLSGTFTGTEFVDLFGGGHFYTSVQKRNAGTTTVDISEASIDVSEVPEPGSLALLGLGGLLIARRRRG